MKKPKFVTLFIDSYSELSLLSDAQTGRLIKALLQYADSGEMPDLSDDTLVQLMFSILKKQIDRDFETYEEKCERRTSSAKKAAQARYRKKEKSCETHATACVSCQDKDKDNNKDNDNNDDKDKYNDDDNSNAHSADMNRASPAIEIAESYEIVDFLNQKAGTSFRATAKHTRRLLADLFRQGYTADDVKRVIDKKCREWKGTEYAKYLRPETLFGERFDSYLHAPLSPPPKPKLGSMYSADPYYCSMDLSKVKPLFDD